MDQLASLSGQAADAKMAKLELENTNKKLTTELAALKEEMGKKEEQIRKLKDRVQFAAVDKAQQDLQKVKAEVQTLTEKLAEANKKIQELQQTISNQQQDLDAIQKERDELWNAQNEAAKNAKALLQAKEEVARLTKELIESKQAHEAAFNSLSQEFATFKTANEMKLDEMESQRRNYKSKAESIQKDLAKIVKIDKKSREENLRLREELARKTKCLKDAIDALTMYMDAEPHEKKSALKMVSGAVTGAVTGVVNTALAPLKPKRPKPQTLKPAAQPAEAAARMQSPARPQSASNSPAPDANGSRNARDDELP
eukprot:NODE_384_length_1713_cov_282.025841_g304_i0.p1 GENE.NODE_384_length_1713_cov_282.025841_g304_i0~~NODE_384_length_1713_cov_282.025841_g304_i0.p1  ORF type:complete len:313 (+),score=100.80 NODE_384_length_1713_cov_282.025841_g304_i0:520-1458(+)